MAIYFSVSYMETYMSKDLLQPNLTIDMETSGHMLACKCLLCISYWFLNNFVVTMHTLSHLHWGCMAVWLKGVITPII